MRVMMMTMMVEVGVGVMVISFRIMNMIAIPDMVVVMIVMIVMMVIKVMMAMIVMSQEETDHLSLPKKNKKKNAPTSA